MTEETKDILLDLGPCHGCMGCVEMAPDVFGWDEENERPYLKKHEATEAEVNDAVACCPKECISLAD